MGFRRKEEDFFAYAVDNIDIRGSGRSTKADGKCEADGTGDMTAFEPHRDLESSFATWRSRVKHNRKHNRETDTLQRIVLPEDSRASESTRYVAIVDRGDNADSSCGQWVSTRVHWIRPSPRLGAIR